jgi:hypothetical protein
LLSLCSLRSKTLYLRARATCLGRSADVTIQILPTRTILLTRILMRCVLMRCVLMRRVFLLLHNVLLQCSATGSRWTTSLRRWLAICCNGSTVGRGSLTSGGVDGFGRHRHFRPTVTRSSRGSTDFCRRPRAGSCQSLLRWIHVQKITVHFLRHLGCHFGETSKRLCTATSRYDKRSSNESCNRRPSSTLRVHPCL